MTWLDERSWPLASTWPVLRNPAYPLPRGYDSDDPVIFRAHNRDGRAARLRVAVVVVGAGAVPGGRPDAAALPRPRPRRDGPPAAALRGDRDPGRRPGRLLRLRRPGQRPALRGRRRLARRGLLVEPPLRAPLPQGRRAPGSLRLGEPQLHGGVAGGGKRQRASGRPSTSSARSSSSTCGRTAGRSCATTSRRCWRPSTPSRATGSTTRATCPPRAARRGLRSRATSSRSGAGPSS